MTWEGTGFSTQSNFLTESYRSLLLFGTNTTTMEVWDTSIVLQAATKVPVLSFSSTRISAFVMVIPKELQTRLRVWPNSFTISLSRGETIIIQSVNFPRGSRIFLVRISFEKSPDF